MKSLTLLFIIFSLKFSYLFSQSKFDYTWLFGAYEGSQIDFNNKGRIDSVTKDFMLTKNNCQISDKNGKLQFYFTGCRVINNTNQIMDGGDSINYGKTWKTYCKGIDLYPGYQSSIIVPDPGNETKGKNGYYLIHKRYELESEPYLHEYTPELYYTYIDMNANNGRGKVVYKDRPAFRTTNTNYGYMAACKHANGRDWWFLQSQRLSDKHFAVLLTSDSIYCADSLNIGDSPADGEIGQATFTPDGSKYLLYNATDDCLIFDFDRSNGKLSNYIHITLQDSAYFTGIAVSPNSRFAYLCADYDLYQIDLWADDIQASLTHIDHIDGFRHHSSLYWFTQAQLAPDCKIYIVSGATNRYLHVINKPNEKGKACDFHQHSIDLIKTNFNNSIPNFPHFRIDESEICDPSITSMFGEAVWYRRDIKVWPNPSSGVFNIELPDEGEGKLVVSNINGQVLYEREVSNIIKDERIDISGYTAGRYNVEFYPKSKEKERVYYGVQVVKSEP